MNWLHAFWGVGATVGPIIMGTVLNNSSLGEMVILLSVEFKWC